MLPLESVEPGELLWTRECRLGLLCQCQVVGSVRLARGWRFPTCGKRLQTILANRLQHGKARLLAIAPGLLKQALVHQGDHSFQHVYVAVADCAGHGLDRPKGAATHKDGESPEEALLLYRQEFIAPGDRAAQGA